MIDYGPTAKCAFAGPQWKDGRRTCNRPTAYTPERVNPVICECCLADEQCAVARQQRLLRLIDGTAGSDDAP